MGHLILNDDVINHYICDACLDLPYCMTEAPPCSVLLLHVHESLVDSVLVSPILFIFQIREVS